VQLDFISMVKLKSSCLGEKKDHEQSFQMKKKFEITLSLKTLATFP